MSEKLYIGMWDFDGACAPPEGTDKASRGGQLTFSLGCFQWQAKFKGGLKKGKVQYRIKGAVGNSSEAYRKAREFCARKNRKNKEKGHE